MCISTNGDNVVVVIIIREKKNDQNRENGGAVEKSFVSFIFLFFCALPILHLGYAWFQLLRDDIKKAKKKKKQKIDKKTAKKGWIGRGNN